MTPETAEAKDIFDHQDQTQETGIAQGEAIIKGLGIKRETTTIAEADRKIDKIAGIGPKIGNKRDAIAIEVCFVDY